MFTPAYTGNYIKVELCGLCNISLDLSGLYVGHVRFLCVGMVNNM